jgi:hypothetical protein
LEAEQPPQELPVPATGTEAPLLSLAKEAKRENMRFEALWHLGHDICSSAWLRARNSSNLCLHCGQQYS